MASDVKRTPLQELVQDTGRQKNPSLQTHHDLRGSLSGTTTNSGLDDSSYDVCDLLHVLRDVAEGCQQEKVVQFLAPADVDETSPSRLLKTLCKDMEQPVASSLGDQCRLSWLFSVVRD
jgi:hypothetical protein